MRVRIDGSHQLYGRVQAPRSKAYTHRALFASLLSLGQTTIQKPLVSDDTMRTLDAIREMGARVRESRDVIVSRGVGVPLPPNVPLDCGESGATLRLLTAISSASMGKTVLIAGNSLAKRPIQPLLDALEIIGASTRLDRAEDHLRVTVQGPLKGGATSIDAGISSQFISGLLMAAPLARDEVRITLEGQIESRPYVEMTLAIMKQHGILLEETKDSFRIPAPQEYRPITHRVPGDFSSAAFLIAAGGTAGDNITISGLDRDSTVEPDSVVLELFPQIGIDVKEIGGDLLVTKGQLEHFAFDASDNPDLVPVLEVLAAQAKGRSEIRGVRRLRYKESNRLETVPEELTKMGAKVFVKEDKVVIDGSEKLVGERLSSHHDHRVAMACATAALAANGQSVIEDAEVVSKSYPAFFNDLERLGARLDVE